jgi:hypothetical protein
VDFESPGALRILPSNTFQLAIEVQSVTLPEGLTSIGALAFDSLTDIRDPSDVSGNLVQISLPSTLTTVGALAFNDLSPGALIDFAGNYPSSGSTDWFGTPDPSVRVRFQPSTTGWPLSNVDGVAIEQYLAAPRPPVATAGVHSATIEVSPNPTGPSWARITITASPGGSTCVITGASGRCTINGLQIGTSYTFTAVAAIDSPELVSVASAPSAAVTPLAPEPPSSSPVPESATPTTVAPEPTTPSTPPGITGGTSGTSELPQTGRDMSVVFIGVISVGIGLLILRARQERRRCRKGDAHLLGSARAV